MEGPGGGGCPVVMDALSGKRCGLTLHLTPDGMDVEPVCLMHSKDPAKQKGELLRRFWERFATNLVEAGAGKARFRSYVFPKFTCQSVKIVPVCDFTGATFTQGTGLLGVRFLQEADFTSATFTELADFTEATFTKAAIFNGASFDEGAIFLKTTFEQAADFGGATFKEKVEFVGSHFRQPADFKRATFVQEAFFFAVVFMEDADFNSVRFLRSADFHLAGFNHGADFSEVTFTEEARFGSTRFKGLVLWWRSRFLGRVEFLSTEFVPMESDVTSAFSLTSFVKPDEVMFDDVDLSLVCFHNCDVSRVWFTSSVRWGKGEGRSVVLMEETMDSLVAEKYELWVNEHLDYKAVAQVYQQLKKNYDGRLDYWRANEFHFGEMEMQRLDGPWVGPLLEARQWWHQRLSLVALYRWGSDYGNSFEKPLWWLVGVLVVFAVALPVAGLAHTVGHGAAAQVWVETYGSAWRAGVGGWQKVWFVVGVLGHGGLTAVDTASFQRNLEYAPVYPWGRVVAIVETLLTSTLVALFFLALRRQFRR